MTARPPSKEMAPLGQSAAGMGKTALASVTHAVDVVLACVAGEVDDVDERRLVIRLRLRGLGDALRKLRGLIDALQRKAHRQADALAHDGALQKDALAIGGDVALDDLVWQLVDPGVVLLLAFVSEASDLLEHGPADLRHVGVDAAHGIAHGFCPLSTGMCTSILMAPGRHERLRRTKNSKKIRRDAPAPPCGCIVHNRYTYNANGSPHEAHINRLHRHVPTRRPRRGTRRRGGRLRARGLREPCRGRLRTCRLGALPCRRNRGAGRIAQGADLHRTRLLHGPREGRRRV